MNWRLKARIQKAVATMPLSNAIYYAMQRTAGSLRPGRLDPIDSFKAAISMVGWIRNNGQDVIGKNFLEVGTGRTVNLPTALWLCGAEQIVTVDLHPYLSAALVAECNQFVRQNCDQVRQLFGDWATNPVFEERFTKLLESASLDLKETLKLMNITYMAPCSAAKLPAADRTFDFHVSHAVFEHIPATEILAILIEARRILVPEGLLIHIIDPSDHFAHDDSSITAINFLQFDNRDWERMAGNQFTYHNRLRGYEYLELFAQAGIELLLQQRSVDQRSLQALHNGFQLNSQFKNIPTEEVAVTSLNVVGRVAER